MRWSMSETCIEAAQSAEVFAFEKVLDQCYLVRRVETTGEEALKVAEVLSDEMPNSMVVVGWAISDMADEQGHAKMYSRLVVPGFPILDFDQSRDPNIRCLGDGDTASHE